MIVLDELTQGTAEMALAPTGIIRTRHSSSMDRTKRSAYALAFGALRYRRPRASTPAVGRAT
jgi:hypothetical protein